ncbi:MAG: DUF1553 domain-containing protein [Verrucomicrobiota bacterium]|nr:DUF1553 domain-containing protein [Verrucomicrobiota bacterium]
MNRHAAEKFVGLRTMRILRFALGLGWMVLELGLMAESPDLFRSQIAPLLETHCLRCHYPGNTKGDISLATPEDLRRGGFLDNPQGEPNSLLKLVQGSGENEPPSMPKKSAPLTESQVGLIRDWILQEAPWPADMVLRESTKADAGWWAFQALGTPEIPEIPHAPEDWRSNPVDAFVLHNLQKHGLSPSPMADRGSLIRRLSYDLTGLPPEPATVEAFIQDPDPHAYAHLVDRLLASPHYGERWGRHWLDVMRFGESRGYERNEIILNAWPFRDYVIRSFNEDKPLATLIREHLAGDQIAPGDPSVEIGTTYLVCGPYDDVGNQDPAQAAQIRANTLDEMIRTTSEAFLGLTVGCSRCHHHKFDPISQEDYYRWYASFAGVKHGSREIASEAQRAARARAIEPLVQQHDAWVMTRNTLREGILERGKSNAESHAATWTRKRIQRTGVEESFPTRRVQHVKLTIEGTERDPDARSGYGIDEFEVWTPGPSPRNVASLALGGTATGASRIAEDFADAYSARLTIDGKYGARWIAQGPELTITLAQATEINRIFFSSDRVGDAGDHSVASFVCDYRIEVSPDGVTWEKVADSHDRKPLHEAHLHRRWMDLEQTPQEQEELRRLSRQIAAVKRRQRQVPDLPKWWAGTFTPIKDPTHVFIGGNPQRRGKEVVPASLSVLDMSTEAYRLDPSAPEATRRLALADWIVSKRNPLTPRVWVNRLWQKHFGTGLVKTPSDFGFMGGQPSHPELLDWLAGELLRNGWRVKPIHKLLVMSQAYRQQSGFRADAARVDGDTRWLWRFPPRRLAAEEIRDTMLSVSGSLRDAMGGPGFRLYRYLQDNVATYVPLDTHGPDTYRRGVYHHNARAAVVDLMTEFDCPDPAAPAPRRASTTTPLQALTMLNHAFTLDMAKAMAEDLKRTAGSDPQAWVNQAYMRCFGRSPSTEETRQALVYRAKLGDTLFCRALFNANAFIHID